MIDTSRDRAEAWRDAVLTVWFLGFLTLVVLLPLLGLSWRLFRWAAGW